MQRMILGLLIVILGGAMLSQTLLGLPMLAAGAWLTTGRGLRELCRLLVENSRFVLRGVLSLLVFVGALWQAWHLIVPALPLFGISLLLLPSMRPQGAPARHGLPSLREVLCVVLLDIYGGLIAQDWSENAAAMRQTVLRAMAEHRQQVDRRYLATVASSNR